MYSCDEMCVNLFYIWRKIPKIVPAPNTDNKEPDIRDKKIVLSALDQ